MEVLNLTDQRPSSYHKLDQCDIFNMIYGLENMNLDVHLVEVAFFLKSPD